MASPPNVEDPSQISRRATIRIVVAIVLLVTAVAILGILHQRKPVPEEAAPEPTPQESISSTQMEAAAPQTATLNSISSPPPPVTEVQTPAPVTPVTPAPTPAAPVATAPPPPPPVVGKLPQLPESSAHPVVKSAPEKKAAHTAPATTPSQAPAEPKAAESKVAADKPQTTPASTKTATPKALEVQVGVFSDPENAKQLQAKLAEHGIPSHMETHLQVGPFKDKAEADAAREKLKALGINGLIMPVK